MQKAFIELHLSILLAGWTGVFGRLIDMSSGLIVFWRIALASLLLWGVVAFRRDLDRVPARDLAGLLAVGLLLMISWGLFYAAIKASNVSVALTAFASVGFFTAIIEPLLTGKRINAREVLFALVAMAGIALIFGFDSRHRTGICLGVLGAATAAVLAVYYRGFRQRYSSVTVLTWQLTGAFLSALLLLPLYRLTTAPEPFLPNALNAFYLVLFASVFTIGMYLLQIQALEKISAFTVNLSFNLEPIYSITIAMILFGEAREVNWSFWTGVALIALSVALQTANVIRLQKRLKSNSRS